MKPFITEVDANTTSIIGVKFTMFTKTAKL